MNINCCHIALFLAGVILALLAMFFNYSLKLKDKSVELSQRTEKLEKKNGAEQKQIDQLKQRIIQLEKNYDQ
jgi:cell division protein FtsL